MVSAHFSVAGMANFVAIHNPSTNQPIFIKIYSAIQILITNRLATSVLPESQGFTELQRRWRQKSHFFDTFLHFSMPRWRELRGKGGSLGYLWVFPTHHKNFIKNLTPPETVQSDEGVWPQPLFFTINNIQSISRGNYLWLHLYTHQTSYWW